MRKHKMRSCQQTSSFYRPQTHEAIAPRDFSIGNISTVVTFLQNTYRYCSKNKFSFLKINLDNVTKIDAFGLALIISMLNKLSFLNIRYWGTYPNDSASKQFIIDSGFLSFVKTNLRKPEERKNGNQLFMIGKASVDSRRIGQAVKNAMKYLLGVSTQYSPVYEDMLEVSANSVEHANESKIEKNWLVSISEEDDKLHFILADTGLGILANLKKKNSQLIKDWLTQKKDEEILEDVFHKLYQSITGEINRHKGLPVIYESFSDGFISNLKILTNKVLYDFGTQKSLQLTSSFNGVLYSWTVSIENYNNYINSLE